MKLISFLLSLIIPLAAIALPPRVKYVEDMEPVGSFTYKGHLFIRYAENHIAHDQENCPCLEGRRYFVWGGKTPITRDTEFHIIPQD